MKIENLIKGDDLLNLEDIKKVLEKSDDKLVLSKQTFENIYKKRKQSRMLLEKTWTLSKAKRWQIKVLKGIYWSWFHPNNFFMKLNLELEKRRKENKKIGEKNWISYNEHGKKGKSLGRY